MFGQEAGMLVAAGVLTAQFLVIAPAPAGGQGDDASGTAALIAVRHTGSRDGWEIAESANFYLWHQSTRGQAERLLRSAEEARARICRRWFSEVGPDWQPRCTLNLYPSREAYQAATGLAECVPAFAHTQYEGERVLSRQIELRGDWPEVLTSVLPHEITHIVLSDKFGSRPLPGWVNEGIAVLSEPPANIARHLRNLSRHRDEGLISPVEDLIEQRAHPQRHALGAFYAQSVSLVQFLEKEKGNEALIAFLHCARRHGFGQALRRHYQMTFADLEQRWRQFAFLD
jgi:hypothetical protein